MKIRAAVLLAIGCLLGRVAFGSTNLVANGGFESGFAGWVALNSNPVTVSGNPLQAHSGNDFLQLGNATGISTQGALQNILVPSNTLVLRFSYFWGCSTGNDPVGADAMSSFIRPNGSSANYLNPHLSASGGYFFETFDLAGYAGQTIQAGFQVDALTNGVGGQTFFAVDDVSMVAFTSDDNPANVNLVNATLLTTTTNVSVTVTNVVAGKEAGEPKHAGNTGGHSVWWRWVAPANGAVVINTTGSTFNTLLAVYTGTVVSNLTQVAANDDQGSGGISQVKFNVTAGQEYKIALDGKNNLTGVAQLNLSFSLDTKDPVAKITSPKNNAQLNNSTVTVQGTAADNLGISLVQYRLENAAGTNDYQNAAGTNTWTATVNGLIPGPNTIRVRAFDTSNNQSPEVAVTVSFVVVSPLTVNITGSGTVTPNLNGTQQPVGKTLTLTAKPGTGQVFSNWNVGDASFTSAMLSFVMQSNMVLTANFIPNPFIPVAGTYQGLIYHSNATAPESFGFFSAKLTSGGSFSAQINLAGKKLSLSGQFSADGSFSNNIARKGASPISAQLNLDFVTGTLSGLFSDGSFTTDLVANRTVTSAGTNAGKYTLMIPGGTDGVAQPGGDGYATIVVSSLGAISLKGVLADGTKVTQKANLLTTDQWPFYVPLYSGRGSVLASLTFSNGVIHGFGDWFKEPGAGGLYPAGFSNMVEVVGSSYVFTSGTPVLNFSAGILAVSNGNLANSFIEGIALDSASKVTSTNATVKMTITTSTGLFKGTVADPVSGNTVSFNGVVLQQQNTGGGFFTGTTQTGRVTISP
jgi:hypothetical protein